MASQRDDDHCNGQKRRHDQSEGRKGESEEIDFERKVEIINQKPRAHRRENRVVDDTGEGLQRGRENPETAAVAHFQKLAHGHCPGFTVAVAAVAGQSENQSQRGGQTAPEADSEAAVVIHLNHGDYADESHCRFPGRHCHYISARDTPRREKVRHSGDIFLGFARNPHDNHQRHHYNQPVNPMHLSSSSL
ncbi:hypothetical protein SDC9_115089 [bioreactor metagenome]|uniref:Uncharacterized protein n=1 Tax=bioreactor metagenome TaxID=1076179 RepID=A0A645BSV3_9ZZZZ